MYRDFTGEEPKSFDQVSVAWPKTALVVGTCDGIMYTTRRDGEIEHYIHKFKVSARPLLVANHDGKSLGLIGGKFNFTERGIVDS
ncbi:MAG: hypothetical protein COB41_05570 [Proteobacteria bacterium]|nr:MAG: hypothetical protein COB41_05570 [Pseudomonadota bacterium]